MPIRLRVLVLSFALSFIANSGLGQPAPGSVPQAARDHLAKAHPKAAGLEWKAGSKQIKAEFTVKGETYFAIYSLKGEWVRTEHNIPKSTLPAAVASALQASKYASWKIDDVEEHSTPQQAQLFKLKVKTETNKAELFFSLDGKLVRVEEKVKKLK